MNELQQARLRAIAGDDIFKRLGIPGFPDGGIVGGYYGTPQVVTPTTGAGGQQIVQVVLDEELMTKQALIIAGETGKQTGNAIDRAQERSDRRRVLEEELFK